MHKAGEYGAAGGTIFLGEGSAESKLPEMTGRTEIEIQKEILMIPSSSEICERLHKMVLEEFMFEKRNKGIAFSIPFMRWQLNAGGRERESSQEDFNPSHYCIMTIVDKGRSRACIKAARAAGARGGTLIHGRGAGIPADFYFPLIIEPQKDIVMVISSKEKTPLIRDRIYADLELGKIGNGIIFTLPVIRASGLIENMSADAEAVTP